MADATGILVFGDAPDGKLASTAQELLAAGRSLADALNQELAIAVIGGDVADAPQQAIVHGADKAYAVTNPALADYHPDLYLSAMQTVAAEANPGIILVARNNEGRELAPAAGIPPWCWDWRRTASRFPPTLARAGCWPTARCTVEVP